MDDQNSSLPTASTVKSIPVFDAEDTTVQHVPGEPVIDDDLSKAISTQLAQLQVGEEEITYEHTSAPQIVIEDTAPVSGGVAVALPTPPVPQETVLTPEQVIPELAAAKKSGDDQRSKVFVSGLMGLLVVFALGATIASFVSGNTPVPAKKIASSSLKPYISDAIEFQRPRDWVDTASVKGFKQNQSGQISSVTFADAVTVTKKSASPDIANAMIQLTKLNVDFKLSNSQFNALLSDTTKRTNFESQVLGQFSNELVGGQDCQSIQNTSKQVSYNQNGFPFVVQSEFDCVLTKQQSTLQNTKTTHYMIKIAETNRTGYMFVIAAKQQSWTLNKSLFSQLFQTIKAD